MEATKFKCTGDCMKCTPIQRAYCSAQISYNTMRMVEDLKEKIEAIQSSEAHVFDPTIAEETAQKGDGAKSRAPK